MTEVRGVFMATRFHNVPATLKDLCWTLNLELRMQVENKGIFFERTRFAISGDGNGMDFISKWLVGAKAWPGVDLLINPQSHGR